jgi:tRNA modification GTPase
MQGKLDLSQAEAVQELIEAGSGRALSLAAAQLAGLPGRRIHDWQQQLQDLLANIEVIHDYAADDLDASLDQNSLLTPEKLFRSLQQLVDQMDAALEEAQRTAPLRNGVTVAICGPPNVGKSTLFNALLGHERAITAPEPGTTRDYVTETLEAAGMRLTLVDTAGYREAADPIESAGVERALEWASGADHVLWVSAADGEREQAPGEVKQMLHVVTRCDLLDKWPQPDTGVVCVSGTTGQGIDALWERLTGFQPKLEASSLEALGSRQSEAVGNARSLLASALAAIESGTPMDAVALDIYAASEALHGSFEQADRNRVIEQVFSGFCVGK